jgi:hypothetical protein
MEIKKYIPILFLFALVSCSKCKDEKVYPTYYMDQEFKDYCVFPVGSYWVYEDSASGAEDSVYLYNQQIYVVENSKSVSYKYERLRQNFSASFYSDTLIGDGGAKYLGLGEPCIYEQFYSSAFLAINFQFFSGRDTGYTFKYNDNYYTTYLVNYDSIKVLNEYFNKVKIFEVVGGQDTRLPKRIFYSKNIGVIRRELYNGQVWNLKRYFINK